MCGIAGIVSLAPDVRVDPQALRTMAGQLVHRGPDDEGYYLDPQARCGFGFRRLSIIDPAGGQQPIANEDGTVWLVFNGEIYNFRELRTELESRGHRFRTRCDSEVIVHLYEQHGEECLRRLAGMFAVAIWDQRVGALLLARDRLGKKPLALGLHEKRLYFASEVKALLAVPGMRREIDPQSLHRYLIFQYVPAPHSVYRGFQKILPGHYLRIAVCRPLSASQQPFWQLPQPGAAPPAAPPRGYAQARHDLGELLKRAVERRLIADVPLGAFLSGGVDSSIVVGLMRRLGVSPLRTFSIGFPDARYDETRYARQVARTFQTQHHEQIVTPRARDVLDTLAWHYDEPFADSSAIPTYYVARYARQFVTVALTGDGGDEAFAGYDRYRAAGLGAAAGRLPRPLRQALAQAAELLPRGRPKSRGGRLYRFLSAVAQPPARRYLAWVNVFPPALLASGYRPEFAERIDFDEPLLWFDRLYQGCDGTDAVKANYADFLSYLPCDLLTKVDIASMACSLECRCPLLDHELVEFALALPPQWRFGPRAGGKHVLKDWARELLPRQVLTRPKMGFGVPVGEWFRGELRSLLEQRLLADNALCQRVFRPRWLRSLLEAHLSGRANYEHPLWALLMLELWHQRWRPGGL